MIPKLSTCIGCELFGNGMGFSNLEGTGVLPLMVVAEALGEAEEKDGLPLRPGAPAGSVFDKALRWQGFDRAQMTLTNVVRCRPPKNWLKDAPWERAAIHHCSQYLEKAIEQRRPKVILALGDIPMRELSGLAGYKQNITDIRGYVIPSKYGVPLLPTYHPSHLVRGAMHLFGVFLTDVARAVSIARNGMPEIKEVYYELHPTIEVARRYLAYLRTRPDLPIAYDIETPYILGQSEAKRWEDKEIIQIQFSSSVGEAIVFPYEGQFIEVAKEIMALSNQKWGWNSRQSDDICLRAHGFVLGGELHDLMIAWGHLQPDFQSKKDEDEGGKQEKGIPAKLMSLQSALSFFDPFFPGGPWKHQSAEDLQFYGAKDTDGTIRCGYGIFESLKQKGLWKGYYEHKFKMRTVLDNMGWRGLPVDAKEQQKVRKLVERAERMGLHKLQKLVPQEVLVSKQKKGYAKVPKDLTGLVERDFIIDGVTVRRWCKLEPFNPGSAQQLLKYIKHMGYPVPKKVDDPAKETTGKQEIEKLEKKTGDPVLKLARKTREVSKVGSSYVGGEWAPGPNGRVHAQFGFGTASSQTTARKPPVQTYPEHNAIAKRAKAAIRAEAGRTLVKIDMRGFHSRMIGFLAEDKLYYDLADTDVHSYVTANFLHLPEWEKLKSGEVTDELRAILKQVKKDHKFTRDYKVKRTVHGLQFGMQLNKLYGMYADNFNPTPERAAELTGKKWSNWGAVKRQEEIARLGRREANSLITTVRGMFPKTFKDFPAWVEHMIKYQTKCRLISPFGHNRWFWTFDMEQATAFLPSNCAHCHIQSALVRLEEMGAMEQFQAVNFTHDALWLHPLLRDTEECVKVVQQELERPSEILHNSLGWFFCHSDAQVGPTIGEMEDVN